MSKCQTFLTDLKNKRLCPPSRVGGGDENAAASDWSGVVNGTGCEFGPCAVEDSSY